jgi:hypothetical protein
LKKFHIQLAVVSTVTGALTGIEGIDPVHISFAFCIKANSVICRLVGVQERESRVTFIFEFKSLKNSSLTLL